MKQKILAVVVSLVLVTVIAGSAAAADLYWSANGSVQGGTGTWNTVDSRWGAAFGGPFETAWNNASSDAAIFGGTAGTVTLGTGITVGGLTFNSTAYTITNAANTLSFGAVTNIITFNSVAAATIAGAVGGSGDVILTAGSPNNAGTVTLTGATGNGWSGSTTVNPGMTLLVGQTSALLANTANININGGTLRVERANDSIAGSQVSDAAPITFNGGGTLIFKQNTAILNKVENVGAVTVASGQANFDLANGTSTTGNTNVLSSLTRSVDSAAFTFSSATTTLTWKVSGQTDTVAGRIIGPWATHGTANPGSGAQTDYAIYTGGNGSVVAANIAASTQDTWTDSDKPYTVDGGTTLAATRTIAALRGSGTAQTVNLGGYSLETYGLLNGGTGTNTIDNGVLTTPAGGGAGTTNNLFITPGSSAITIAGGASITDNGAAVRLVKSGGNPLILSGNNTYSGGTLINAGTLAISTNSNLGADGAAIIFSGSAALNQLVNIDLGSRPIVLNMGAVATLGSQSATSVNLSTAGAVTGDGSLIWQSNHGGVLTLSSASNTFTGALVQKPGSGGYSGGIVFSSIADAPGVGPIIFNGAEGNATGFTYDGTKPLTLNYRRLTLDTGTGMNLIRPFKNNSANAVVTINTDLLIYGPSNNRGLSFGGTNTLLNTFAGKMSDFSGGTFSLYKVDAGTWYFSNTNNTYTGPTTISAGILAVSKLSNGGLNSSIGASSSNAASLVMANGTLRYVGSGDSSDRSFSIGLSTSGNGTSATLDASGTGALNLSSTAFQAYGIANFTRTLNLTGSSTSDNTIAATFTNNGTGAFSLSKTGVGKWVLTGSDTGTGTSSLSGGGTLVLDYTGGDSSRLPSGGLTLGGGTLELRGGSQTQILGAVQTMLAAGGSLITRSAAGASRLRMNLINRAVGGTIDFADASIADTDMPHFGTSGANGILGGWATLGSHWACSTNSGAADTLITALSNYTAFVTSGGSSAANYQLTGDSSLTGALAVGSLRISNNGNSQTLSLGNNNLAITSSSVSALGGILYAGGEDGNYTLSGGTGRIVTSTGNQELIISVSTGTLSVGAFVAASGSTGPVTKSGAGRLEIASNNNYTGALRVNQGIVRLANDNAAGTTAGGIVVQNGSALELANSVNIGAEALTITGTGVANAGALRNVAGNTASYAGMITIGVGGARINSDVGGSLTLCSNLVTSAFNDITIGGSGNTTISGVISGAGNLIKDGSGTLTLAGAGANTLTGDTVVNSGKLLISSAAGAIGNGSALRIASGAKLELAEGVNEVVGQLYLDGQPAPAGLWGSAGSGADNEDVIYFTGTGMITVSQTGSGTPYSASGPAGTVLILR